MRKLVSQKIEAYNKKNKTTLDEDVEIRLWCEIMLKEPLNLLTVMEGMSYPTSGKREDVVNLQELIKEVNSSYLEALLSNTLFAAIVDKDTDFKNRWVPEGVRYALKMERLKETKPKGGELDPDVLNWTTEMNKLTIERDLAKAKARKQWWLDRIK